MQLLATADQMQQIDRTAIGKLGIPGIILMENSGRSFVNELSKRITPLPGKHITVLCGKGNNGGDGYVIARHLLNRGCAVNVVLLCKRKDVQDDARVNLDILLRLRSLWKRNLIVVNVSSLRQLSRLQKPDVVVDAVFGTGFRGKAQGIYLAAIEWINRTGAYVASVDICSGANASTGIVEAEAVKADVTVTFGLAKVGQFVGRGRENSGEVVVTDISIPRILFGQEKLKTCRILKDDVAEQLPRRPLTAHKYSVGKIFILAGSRRFTGAPFMTAQAAMRTGAGAVIVGLPKSVQPVLARKFTEVMIAPLDETEGGSLSVKAFDAILERVRWADAVAIGPGLTRDPKTIELVRRLIPVVDKPLVLDADAFAALPQHTFLISRRRHPTILTPHAGELGIISERESSLIENERVDAARQTAKALRCIVCLKGSPTVTALPSGEALLNSTGNPGMATIGSGDVLTGIVASLLGQRLSPDAAAYSGVFLHGLAGDLAAAKLGQRSLMAMDILNHISNAMSVVERK